MWLFVTTAVRKYAAIIFALGSIVAGIFLYGVKKKSEGRSQQIQKDRRTIDEMVERKEERRVITQPIDVERRRERVRRQRDELTKGVLRP